MKPCITTWPASVPTEEDDRPDASSATPKAIWACEPDEVAQAVEDLVDVLHAGQAAGVEDARRP